MCCRALVSLALGQCFLIHPAYKNPLRHFKKYYSRSNVSFPSSLRTNKQACKTHHLLAPFPVFSPLSSHHAPAGHLCYHPPGRREPRQRTGVDERGVEQWALKFNNSKNALFLWLSVAQIQLPWCLSWRVTTAQHQTKGSTFMSNSLLHGFCCIRNWTVFFFLSHFLFSKKRPSVVLPSFQRACRWFLSCRGAFQPWWTQVCGSRSHG